MLGLMTATLPRTLLSIPVTPAAPSRISYTQEELREGPWLALKVGGNRNSESSLCPGWHVSAL